LELAFELAHGAELRARVYWRDRGRLPRQSVVIKRFGKLSANLASASVHLEALGRSGILALLAASRLASDLEDEAPEEHIAYLRNLANWASKAAVAVKADQKHMKPDPGGPTPDIALRDFVYSLARLFRDRVGINPTHTFSAVTDAGESLFDRYVRGALDHFAPAAVELQRSAINFAVREAVARLKEDTTGSFRPPRRNRPRKQAH
jgi:hypothetical protein